jgi:hypothetical protein
MKILTVLPTVKTIVLWDLGCAWSPATARHASLWQLQHSILVPQILCILINLRHLFVLYLFLMCTNMPVLKESILYRLGS